MTNSAHPEQLAKPIDLDLHCLQKQGISGFSRTRVNTSYKDNSVFFVGAPRNKFRFCARRCFLHGVASPFLTHLCRGDSSTTTLDQSISSSRVSSFYNYYLL